MVLEEVTKEVFAKSPHKISTTVTSSTPTAASSSSAAAASSAPFSSTSTLKDSVVGNVEDEILQIEIDTPIASLVVFRQAAARGAVVEVEKLRADPDRMHSYCMEHGLFFSNTTNSGRRASGSSRREGVPTDCQSDSVSQVDGSTGGGESGGGWWDWGTAWSWWGATPDSQEEGEDPALSGKGEYSAAPTSSKAPGFATSVLAIDAAAALVKARARGGRSAGRNQSQTQSGSWNRARNRSYEDENDERLMSELEAKWDEFVRSAEATAEARKDFPLRITVSTSAVLHVASSISISSSSSSGSIECQKQPHLPTMPMNSSTARKSNPTHIGLSTSASKSALASNSAGVQEGRQSIIKLSTTMHSVAEFRSADAISLVFDMGQLTVQDGITRSPYLGNLVESLGATATTTSSSSSPASSVPTTADSSDPQENTPQRKRGQHFQMSLQRKDGRNELKISALPLQINWHEKCIHRLLTMFTEPLPVSAHSYQDAIAQSSLLMETRHKFSSEMSLPTGRTDVALEIFAPKIVIPENSNQDGWSLVLDLGEEPISSMNLLYMHVYLVLSFFFPSLPVFTLNSCPQILINTDDTFFLHYHRQAHCKWADRAEWYAVASESGAS